MVFISFYRIIKFAGQSFWRNIWLSVVTITILVLTLFSLTSLIVLNVMADQAIITIKDKIDISLYFKPETEEEQAKLIGKELEKFEEVKEVSYISSEEALNKFKEVHENDPLIEEALRELEENPLGPTLTVKAKDLNLYPQILQKIEDLKIDTLVKEIDYEDHKLVISRLNDLSDKVRKFGIALSLVFTFIAILIMFNTIRIGIYTHREEISIMKLVGATNWFIKAPFLVEALLYALVSVVIFWLILYLILGVTSPFLFSFFKGLDFDLIYYFKTHFFAIFGFESILLILLNIFSTSIAIGKYLRV